ncbi:MAG: exosortase/archaeosortase family protein [Phycisphaeraceae bacterium]|nr:exosortase/archaeosortase family protein [Phycisphaeraceae bacterium]
MSTVATSPSARFQEPSRGTIQLTPTMALVGGVVLFLIFVSVFWHFLYMQVRSGVEEPADWGHVLVIPFVSGWFIWLRREELLRQPFKPAWSGLILMVVGLLIYAMTLLGPVALQHPNFQGGGVVLTLCGMALLLCGWRAMKWLWFPIVYWGIFGQRISEQALQVVTLRLQDIAARGAYFLLNAIGFDTDIAGNILTVHGSDGVAHPLNVAEACSGMRMLVAFMALGVAMAVVGLDKWWQRAALIVMAAPVAVAVNILRVATLGLLSLRDVNMVQGEFHHFVGMVWLVPGFIMFLGVQWCLKVLGEGWRVPVGGAHAR